MIAWDIRCQTLIKSKDAERRTRGRRKTVELGQKGERIDALLRALPRGGEGTPNLSIESRKVSMLDTWLRIQARTSVSMEIFCVRKPAGRHKSQLHGFRISHRCRRYLYHLVAPVALAPRKEYTLAFPVGTFHH